MSMKVWTKLTSLFGSADSASSASTSAATAAPADDSRPSDDLHIDVETQPIVPSASSTVFPPNALGLSFYGEDNNTEESQTPVETASTTTEEKVLTSTSLEAHASSISETTPESIDENPDAANTPAPVRAKIQLPTFKTPAPVWPADDMDGLLDIAVNVTGEPVRYSNVNAGVVAVAQAEGIKVRDFATSSTSDGHAPSINDPRIPEVFRAHEKALQFHYLRWLFLHGIFDLPYISLTAEDVDRLYTIGYINNDELDFISGAAMLSHGAYRRLLRATGVPMFDGQKLPPRAPWTISNNSFPPTLSEIQFYIGNNEVNRFDDAERNLCVFRLLATQRPAITGEWMGRRYREFGSFGLKYIGIDDEAAKKIVSACDMTYIHPEMLDEEIAAPIPIECVVSPELVKLAWKAATGPIIIPSDKPVAAPKAVVVQEPSPIRGRGSGSRGTKRQRSPSSEREAVNDSPSSNRARIASSSREPEPTFSPLPAYSPVPSPCVERTQRKLRSKPNPVSSTTGDVPKPQGQKRARESDEESEFWFPASKKHKDLDELDDLDDIPPLSLPPPLRLTAQPLRRQQRMGIDFERGVFYELAPDDVRRVHGAAFPGANLDNEETQVFVRRSLRREARVNIDLDTGRTWPVGGEQHGWCFPGSIDSAWFHVLF